MYNRLGIYRKSLYSEERLMIHTKQDYDELFNSPVIPISPDEELMDYCREFDPTPTDEQLNRLYEQMEALDGS